MISTSSYSRSMISCQGKSTNTDTRTRRIPIPTLVSKPSSNSDIRNRYLRKLGVSPDSNGARNNYNRGSSHRHQYQRKISPITFAYRESLKINKYSTENEVLNSRSPNGVTGFFDLDLSAMLFPKRPSVVTFDDMVDVRVIPNKEMHSQRMVKVLWSNLEETAMNAQRNYKEFQYESCDWNRAVEDENFVTCPDTGDKIHPVHLHWLDLVMARNRSR
jgi:nuclear transport factor 2 (NTF2) superfamily protein